MSLGEINLGRGRTSRDEWGGELARPGRGERKWAQLRTGERKKIARRFTSWPSPYYETKPLQERRRGSGTTAKHFLKGVIQSRGCSKTLLAGKEKVKTSRGEVRERNEKGPGGKMQLFRPACQKDPFGKCLSVKRPKENGMITRETTEEESMRDR